MCTGRTRCAEACFLGVAVAGIAVAGAASGQETDTAPKVMDGQPVPEPPPDKSAGPVKPSRGSMLTGKVALSGDHENQLQAGGLTGRRHRLADAQIALLCEIGEPQPSGLSSDQKRDLDRLASGGFMEPSESGARKAFTLTAKAMSFSATGRWVEWA